MTREANMAATASNARKISPASPANTASLANRQRPARRSAPANAASAARARAAHLLPVLPACILLSLSVAPGRSHAQARPASPAQASGQASGQVSDTEYTSALVCGRCHTDIYNSWKNSMHAYSLSDPIFEVAFMQAIKAAPNAKELCLRCHAPVTLLNKDVDLAKGVTREGVTCDFCHTVTGVQVGDRHWPYLQELGRIKRSTLAHANSPAHDVAYSDLHKRSEFCGACHYAESENGTVVMGTYAEWKAGPYAREGIQCQNCHMVLGGGRIVQRDVKEKSGPINLHDLIHDTNQLKSALSVRIKEMTVSGNALVVNVEIANVGSGHMMPTGVPNRELTLQVEAKLGDGTVLRDEKCYRKILAGEDGKPLTLDYEAFLFARSVLSDNRIGPKETRLETFRFEVPEDERVEVSASAVYGYKPLVLDTRRMAITLASDNGYVYRRSGR